MANERQRQVKVEIRTKPRGQRTGNVKSPKGTDYLFYMFCMVSAMKNLTKYRKEIMDSKHPNYMLFAKSQQALPQSSSILSINTLSLSNAKA